MVLSLCIFPFLVLVLGVYCNIVNYIYIEEKYIYFFFTLQILHMGHRSVAYTVVASPRICV